MSDDTMELSFSGTSNSSIINIETTSSTTACNNDDDYVETEFVVTKELFPLTGGGEAAVAEREHWLDLSGNHGGPMEKRIIVADQPAHQRVQQQVKKSRRGPRSKSSQYRGVTFYRRTGRWESHIWDSIQPDERRLTELGRRTIEIFVLADIFSKIEVAYQETVALKRQEELIREEAVWLAEVEQKAKRASEKEKKSKKKQSKQKRNTQKAKDEERENLILWSKIRLK